MSAAIKHLYADGGVRCVPRGLPSESVTESVSRGVPSLPTCAHSLSSPPSQRPSRFYAGVGAAMLQAPLARFGDTAANAGALALLADVDLPMALKTVVSSLAASSFRILLMPLDACKTVMQVEGKHGLTLLAAKVRRSGVPVLWAGGMGAASATAVGHYPFFRRVVESRPPHPSPLPRAIRTTPVVPPSNPSFFFTCRLTRRSVYNGLDAYLPKYDRRCDRARGACGCLP